MDLKEKLSILADAAKYDASCASSGVKRKAIRGGIGNSNGVGICHSYTPDGRCISLLKILFTNFCIYDCSYCINRNSSSVKRAKFTVDEVVNLTMNFYQRNYIEGLFLSSGVLKSPDETMEDLIAVAKILRVEKKFGGYIHIKAVAGASAELLRKAGLYADRLSANIELPTQNDLDKLAPAKTHIETEESMSVIKEAILESKEERGKSKKASLFAPGGQSTQMIVGATQTTDKSIMEKAHDLYKGQSLKRVYYTAYSPIPDSSAALPALSPPLMREHRLYQTDWLIRMYGFQVHEIFSHSESLSLDLDPKLSWALAHRDFFPLDVNLATREELLRVPGLGIRNVNRIIIGRRHRKVRWEDLLRLRLNFEKVKHFISTGERENHLGLLLTDSIVESFTKKESVQLDLFESSESALTGEV
jgi:putative DNA modification/repair radical SAM protein